jgi:hypothetical protein
MAARSDALETRTMPEYGMYISTMRKMAAETDTAAVKKLVMTVAFVGANNPKLTNKAVSQKISTTSSEKDIEVAACSNINHRVCIKSNAILEALDCNERCASSFGVSP